MGYTRKAIATRGRILDNAAELMFSKGFVHTKLMEVLTAAKIQKGNFYYYFASKDDLGLAVIRERGAQLVLDWLETVIDPSADPWMNVQTLVRKIVGEHSNEEQGRNPVMKLALELSDLNKDFRLAIGSVLNEVVNALANEFTRLKNAGRLISMDLEPKDLAVLLFSIVQGAVLHFNTNQDAQVLTRTTELGLNLIGKNVNQ